MTASVVSEGRVPVAPYQQVPGSDLTAMGLLGQGTLDNVVGNILMASVGYTGLGVSQVGSSNIVTVQPGYLIKSGPGYSLRDAFQADLTAAVNAVPSSGKSIKVAILADGQEFPTTETRTFVDASRLPTDPTTPAPTVTQATPTRIIRSVVISAPVGIADVQPSLPAYNASLCLIATVTVSNIGIVSVVQNTALQITRLDQLTPIVVAQGAQLASYQSSISGLLSAVSGLALSLSQLKSSTASQLAALQAALTALSAQQVSSATTGSTTVVTITDTFVDTTGLTLTANPGYSVGSGLTFPAGSTNPISYFPLAQYGSNLKVIGSRYLTAPYTEVHDGGNDQVANRNLGNQNNVTAGPNPTNGYATNTLGPWNVTPKREGFAVQRTRYGSAYGVQSAPAIQASGDPSQLFGSSSYVLAYDPTWQSWTSYSPEIDHRNGLWRDLAARGFWGPRTAGVATGNLPAVSQVFQTDTDDMVTSFRAYHTNPTNSVAPRLLVCEELNGVPDPNNVLLDITGTLIDSSNTLWNGFYSDLFVFPFPLLRKAGRRYHFTVVYGDTGTTTLLSGPSYNPDSSMKAYLVRNSNGGWSQDANGNLMCCGYTRANFTAGATPVELNTVTLNGGIDALDILTPIVMPQGCDVYYGTYASNGAYSRLMAINPTDPTTNILAGRPSLLRLAVEIVPTGRTAPIIDMTPTAFGTTTAVPVRRAGTLTAQSAVRAPVDATGKPVAVTKIGVTVTLQNFNPSAPASHTFAVTLGTGTNFATSTAPSTTTGPTAQPDGTVQFTFSWTLSSAVTTWVQNYNGTTGDVTQTYTCPKAITTAAP